MEFAAHLLQSTDSLAVVEFHLIEGELPAEMVANLVGPFCAASRTLSTAYPLELRSSQGLSAAGSVSITDPCYWTPDLPFLYRLEFSRPDAAGRVILAEQPLGLRRLRPFRQSLLWNGRRVVLRGAAVDQPFFDSIDGAKAAGMTLLASDLTKDQGNAADQRGVPLICDLRDRQVGPIDLQRLSTRASVAIILVDAHQVMPCDLDRLTPQSIVAVAVYSDDAPEFSESSVPSWCDAMVVELEEQPLPSEAPSKWNKPVIAIRRGVTYADFHEARAACDRLQAELAPEFDLAGYFVAP
jgi:hypothetical protein